MVGKYELINYYNENIKTEEKVNDKWYEKLFMYKLEIIVTEQGCIGAQTCLDDNYYGNWGSIILRIDLFEKEIRLMEY